MAAKAAPLLTVWAVRVLALVAGGQVVRDPTVFRHAGPWWMLVETNPRHPAGSVVLGEGQPVRFAQDCEPEYGMRVHALAIAEIAATDYRERYLGLVLDAGQPGWNAAGMHHLDAKEDGAGGWIACVDGRH